MKFAIFAFIFTNTERMGKNRNKLIYGLAAIGLVVVIIMGWWAKDHYSYFRHSSVSGTGYVYVPTGASTEKQLDVLLQSGLLSDHGRFQRHADRRTLSGNIRPGRYELREGMTYRELFNRLRAGNQAPVNVTFNNIRTPDRLAGAVARYIEADSAEVLQHILHPQTAERYGFTSESFIGMFIPNTYQFFWNTDPEGFTDRMKKEYDRFWNADREAKRQQRGLTREEVIALASIVQEETVKTDEMPRVAGVYLNRIKIDMPLQADPTLKYALGDFSIRRVLNVHKEIDSPYNTYMYKGIPPGPICIPSISAVDAVLEPEEHNYLYFCAKEDFSGYHNFATNLAEHLRNSNRYTSELNRLGIMR